MLKHILYCQFEVPRLKNMEQVDLAKINDSDEESGDIERHFTADEYASMPEYERSRYRNIKRNYQAMTKLGIWDIIYIPCFSLFFAPILINTPHFFLTKAFPFHQTGIRKPRK